MRIVGYCLMPNHFHIVVWPRNDGDLNRWMHWLLTAHVRRRLIHHRSYGHIWQGRFKAFHIQEYDHLITVLRYVERNPLRASLVDRAERWLWSSLNEDQTIERPLLDAGPVPRGALWVEGVNAPMTEAECDAIRKALQREMPFGSDAWASKTADRLGLDARARSRGRPARELAQA